VVAKKKRNVMKRERGHARYLTAQRVAEAELRKMRYEGGPS
jgi:hypothetical protein